MTGRYFIHIAALLCFSNSFAQSNVIRLKGAQPKPRLSGWSLLIPSFVIHGSVPGRNAATEMPRKLDGGGVSVMTLGLGFEYVAPSGAMVLGAMFKDCYDGLAGSIQFGEFYRIDRDTRWGLSFGLYARETPMACSDNEGLFAARSTSCKQIENIPWGTQTTVNGYPVDIIPMPFFHLSHTVVASRSFRVDLRLMSNVVLNEFGIAIPF